MRGSSANTVAVDRTGLRRCPAASGSRASGRRGSATATATREPTAGTVGVGAATPPRHKTTATVAKPEASRPPAGEPGGRSAQRNEPPTPEPSPPRQPAASTTARLHCARHFRRAQPRALPPYCRVGEERRREGRPFVVRARRGRGRRQVHRASSAISAKQREDRERWRPWRGRGVAPEQGWFRGSRRGDRCAAPGVRAVAIRMVRWRLQW